MTIRSQAQHLIDLGVPDLAGISADDLRAHTDGLPESPGAVLAIHPGLVPAAALAGLLWVNGRPGFVVADLVDLAQFTPIEAVKVPDQPLYVVTDLERGDEMANWSPNEALPAITGRGRTPLTISEGISWLLQEPERLERGRCFMTIGSRRPKPAADGARPAALDARTPAIWLSNGTGRDGNENRGAPKVGWCWAGNRHTWLGFASAAHRTSGEVSRTA